MQVVGGEARTSADLVVCLGGHSSMVRTSCLYPRSLPPVLVLPHTQLCWCCSTHRTYTQVRGGEEAGGGGLHELIALVLGLLKGEEGEVDC